MPTNYEILGFNSNDESPTLAEVKKAYRRLAKEWHPDKKDAADKTAAAMKFNEIQQAYDSILDELEGGKKWEDLLYNEIFAHVIQWPDEMQQPAKRYLNDSTIVSNIQKLIDENYLKRTDFEKPQDPLLWQILSNQHYINNFFMENQLGLPIYSPHEMIYEFLFSDLLENLGICRQADYFTVDFTEREKNLPIEQLTLNQLQRFWLFMATNISIHPMHVNTDNPFLYMLKWKILKENIDLYINSKGVKNAEMLSNTFATFGCNHGNECAAYLQAIYDEIVIPLQNKIDSLKEKNNRISTEKAYQIEFALNILEKKMGASVSQFLYAHQHQLLEREEVIAQVQHLHETLAITLSDLYQSKMINKRSNLIGDILRGVLGIFVATIGLGFPCLSQKFRHSFFAIKSPLLMKQSFDKVKEKQNAIFDNLHGYQFRMLRGG